MPAGEGEFIRHIFATHFLSVLSLLPPLPFVSLKVGPFPPSPYK